MSNENGLCPVCDARHSAAAPVKTKCDCTCHFMVNVNRSFGNGMWCGKCRDIHEPLPRPTAAPKSPRDIPDHLSLVSYLEAHKADPGVLVAERDTKPTLRDQFAMAAMQGDWASQGLTSERFNPKATVEDLCFVAQLYYRMADAMLKVRTEQ